MSSVHFWVLFLFMLPPFLSGCRTHRYVSERRSADSAFVRVETRVERVPDTIVVEVPAERMAAVQDTASRLETSFAVSEARVRGDGRLFHSLENKPQKRMYEVKKEIVYRDSVVYRDRRSDAARTVEKERGLSWWERFQTRGFWILLALCAGCALLRIRNIIKT